ncbi:hypothetical protein ACQ4PT_045884 [Festuca glaucescens]
MADRTKLTAVVARRRRGGRGRSRLRSVFLAIWLRTRRASVAAGRTRSLESSTGHAAGGNGNGNGSVDSSISVSVSESAGDWAHNPLPAGKRVAFWGWRGGDHHPPSPSPESPNTTTSQHILIYEFMSNGNLASLPLCLIKIVFCPLNKTKCSHESTSLSLIILYHVLLLGDNKRSLTWQERLQIAHDVSHGIEYLHEGAVPPVIHRDLKSANILLDHLMRAKVADFGLSKEEVFDGSKSGLKGTYGYMGS